MNYLFWEEFPSPISEKDFNRYKTFIESRPERQRDRSTYTENHHIFPKCYCKGSLEYLKKDKSNFILLTGREHYIAHLMLWKSFKGKMANAFTYMNRNRCHKVRLTSREFERLAKDTAMFHSTFFTGYKHTAESRKKMSEALMGHVLSKETKAKIGAKAKGRIASEEARNNMRKMGADNHFYGKKHTSETKEKLRIANAGQNSAWYG